MADIQHESENLYFRLYRSIMSDEPPLREYLYSEEFTGFLFRHTRLLLGVHYFRLPGTGRFDVLSLKPSSMERTSLPVLIPSCNDVVLAPEQYAAKIFHHFREQRERGHAEFYARLIDPTWSGLNAEERHLGVLWCEDGEVSAFLLEWIIRLYIERAGGGSASWSNLERDLFCEGSVLRGDLTALGYLDFTGSATQRFMRMLTWLRTLDPSDGRWAFRSSATTIPWASLPREIALKCDETSDPVRWILELASAHAGDSTRNSAAIESMVRFNLEGHYRYRLNDSCVEKHVIHFPLLPPESQPTTGFVHPSEGFFVGTISPCPGDSREDLVSSIKRSVPLMCLLSYPSLTHMLRESERAAGEEAAWRRFIAGLNHILGNGLDALALLEDLRRNLDSGRAYTADSISLDIQTAIAPASFARTAIRDLEEVTRGTGDIERIDFGGTNSDVIEAFANRYWKRAGFADGIVYGSTSVRFGSPDPTEGKPLWFRGTLDSILLQLLVNAAEHDLIGSSDQKGVIWSTAPAWDSPNSAWETLPNRVRSALLTSKRPISLEVIGLENEAGARVRQRALRQSLRELLEFARISTADKNGPPGASLLKVEVTLSTHVLPRWIVHLDDVVLGEFSVPLFLNAELSTPEHSEVSHLIDRALSLPSGWRNRVNAILVVSAPCTTEVLARLEDSIPGDLTDRAITLYLHSFAKVSGGNRLGLATLAFLLRQRNHQVVSSRLLKKSCRASVVCSS